MTICGKSLRRSEDFAAVLTLTFLKWRWTDSTKSKSGNLHVADTKQP